METVWVRPTPACVRFTSALCWPEHQLQISVRGSHRTGCGRPWAGTLSDLDQGQWTTSPPAHAGGSCQFQVGRMVAEVTIRPKWGTVGHDHAHWMARGSGLNQAPGFLLPSPRFTTHHIPRLKHRNKGMSHFALCSGIKETFLLLHNVIQIPSWPHEPDQFF